MRRFFVIALASIALPSAVAAQCRLCAAAPSTSAKASDALEHPLTIEVEAALDFSRIAQLGPQGGTVSVDPRSGTRSVSGGLKDLGGGVLKGQVHVQGAPLRPIRVVLPNRVTLTAADGSCVDVVNLTTDLPPNAALGLNGTLSFSFGGQLNIVRANAGDYHGRIPISVEYQ